MDRSGGGSGSCTPIDLIILVVVAVRVLPRAGVSNLLGTMGHLDGARSKVGDSTSYLAAIIPLHSADLSTNHCWLCRLDPSAW